MKTIDNVKPTVLKGCKRGGQVGHRKTMNGRAVKYLHGNGCKEGGPSCFECPFPDCRWYS